MKCSSAPDDFEAEAVALVVLLFVGAFVAVAPTGGLLLESSPILKNSAELGLSRSNNDDSVSNWFKSLHSGSLNSSAPMSSAGPANKSGLISLST
jgi:hypothetical protein